MCDKLGVDCLLPQGCENYVESWWKRPDGEPKMVCDCAIKRLFLMVQGIINGQIGLQAAQEQQRNKSEDAIKFMAKVTLETLEVVQDTLGIPKTINITADMPKGLIGTGAENDGDGNDG
jgi:hypothetical protein